jgi:hypothetical protein
VEPTTEWASTPRNSTSLNKSSDISRNSLEPPAIYEDDEQHTGPASGLAFLQQAVQRIENSHESPRDQPRERPVTTSASIFTSGDIPNTSVIPASFQMPTEEGSNRMLSRYFDFATPTYRFFHRPTVER